MYIDIHVTCTLCYNTYTGLSLHTFHGNFFVRSTDLLSLPLVNPDHAYTINIAIDESLKDLDVVCFQAALLYTSSRGSECVCLCVCVSFVCMCACCVCILYCTCDVHVQVCFPEGIFFF